MTALLVSMVCVIGCDDPAAQPATREPFESVFPVASSLALEEPPGDPIGMIADADVQDSLLYVADRIGGNIKVFDLATGAFRYSLGRPGDGPGEFRAPSSLVVYPDGSVLILDIRHNRLTRFHNGVYAGEVNADSVDWYEIDSDRTTGEVAGLGRSIGGAEEYLVQFLDDETGTFRPLPRTPPTHLYENNFSRPAATLSASAVVLAEQHTGLLRWFDEHGEVADSATLYPPPTWPESEMSLQEAAQWANAQTWIRELIALDEHSVIAALTMPTDSGRMHEYHLIDRGGSHRQTTATKRVIRDAEGGQVFALRLDENGTAQLTIHGIVEP